MKTITIFKNESQLSAFKNELSKGIESYQKTLDLFNGLNLKIQVSEMSDLHLITRDPRAWIKEQVIKRMPEGQTILGVKISKANAFELMELPDLTEINNHCSENKVPANVQQYLKIEKSKVIIDKKAWANYEKMFTISATDSIEAEAMEAHENLKDALLKMSAVLPIHEGTKISELIKFNGHTEIEGINPFYWDKWKDHLRTKRAERKAV